MTDPPNPIIRKIVCPEHLCRIFSELKLLELVESGLLILEQISLTQKKEPFIDYRGAVCVASEMNRIVDPQYAPTDPRYERAKTHRHITDTGDVGASGLHDPKVITTSAYIRYQPLPKPTSTCDLCEAGDMIHPKRRFFDAKYKPSLWRYYLVKFRAMIRP
jgi:hypothetical protein